MVNEQDMMHGVEYLYEDVTDWLMSEKHEGCRAFWDGSQMWTRGGKVITLSPAMRKALPVDITLDGEIHAGRGGFEIARKHVQYGHQNDAIQFSAFDMPRQPGIFSHRYKVLSHLLPVAGIVNYVQHSRLQWISEALELMRVIQANGGEGVILRKPENTYTAGRTDHVLKLKVAPLQHFCSSGVFFC